MILTSELIRTARALLRWEQKDLARASKVSLPSIKRLETQRGPLAAQDRTVAALRTALEEAGIEFTNGGRPGVRMRSRDPMTAADREAFQFAEELLGLAIEIVGAAKIDVTAEGPSDPKIIALTLLCRTITNFKGAMFMVREEAIIEARTLVRLCFENLIWVGALSSLGTSFVKEMRDDEAANRRSLGELAIQLSTNSDAAQIIRQRLRDMSANYPKPSRINAKKAASLTVVDRAYIFFAQLSLDAVHPSLTALNRHITTEFEADSHYLTVNVVPPLRPGERLNTIDEACNALIGVCVGVNEMLGGTSKSDALRTLFERFEVRGDRRHDR